jgi:Cdc6-like AAA superfamily ATPase
MDLRTRIRRRQHSTGDTPLVVDYDAISPVAHLEEPVGRGPLLERLLDHLDPALGGGLPPDAYLHGPGGTGKSAVVSALFAHLTRLASRSSPVIHTSTRAGDRAAPTFVYVDARHAASEFALVRAVLDGVTDDPVPEDGVGTATLRSRLADELRRPDTRVAVAIDHVAEPTTLSTATLADALDLPGLTWLAVGRRAPGDLSHQPPARIAVDRYDTAALVDLLTERVSAGVARDALDHEQVRRIADWADGDAHDGLAAVFAAADRADAAGHDHVRERDLDAGMADVPRPSVPLGRVVALPARRQAVLRALVDLDEGQRDAVAAASEAIAPAIDLSPSTVKRFLYELAEAGVVDRVPGPSRGGAGRPPSRLDPRFPTRVFRVLYDRAH